MFWSRKKKDPADGQPDRRLKKEWSRVYKAYRPGLAPNRREPWEILAFLMEGYPVQQVVAEEVVAAARLRFGQAFGPLPGGGEPKLVVVSVKNEGAGADLYAPQTEAFRRSPIFVAVDEGTGRFLVEGSSTLQDRLTAFAGLSAQELEVPRLVYEYLRCQGVLGVGG